MLFLLGLIAGLALATFVATVLILIRKPLYQATLPIVKVLENAGPREKGGIYIPRDDAEVARDNIVAENRERGLDTKIEELQ